MASQMKTTIQKLGQSNENCNLQVQYKESTNDSSLTYQLEIIGEYLKVMSVIRVLDSHCKAAAAFFFFSRIFFSFFLFKTSHMVVEDAISCPMRNQIVVRDKKGGT
ncbi:GQ67_00390T0 [Komagataella phaffii]|nr:GQ67_00390T0 [Komagataella phaffii]AOA67496.1 GQ68_00999T0 [Komagataella phaffii GS115]CAH2448512.1 Conserved predicted protein [Komagataella phaffii CBS 7435]